MNTKKFFVALSLGIALGAFCSSSSMAQDLSAHVDHPAAAVPWMAGHPGMAGHRMFERAPFVRKIVRNDTLRARLERKMTPADASALESAVTDVKAQMQSLKSLRDQFKAARGAHDTTQLRVLENTARPYLKSLRTDRKTIHDLLLRYHKKTAAGSAAGGLQVKPIYPNPFHAGASANVQYSTAASANVHISLIDAQGHVVREIQNEQQQPGEHSVAVPTSGLKPGGYLVQIQADNENRAVKLMIVQ